MTSKPQPARNCLCGCGGTVSTGSTFIPGHDSKLHSRWLKVKRGESKEKLTREQMAYGDERWVVTERKPKPAKAKVAKPAKPAKGKAKAKVAKPAAPPATETSGK